MMKTALPLVTALLLMVLAVAPAAEPFLEKQDLFSVGDDPAHDVYHIPGIVVTARGSVLACSESKAHRRIVTTSRDGATGWSTPRFDEALLEPICMAGLVRYDHDGRSLLLFSNPHNLEGGREGAPEPGKSRARKNVSVKLSRDEGSTWPVNKLLEDGPSAYSDLAVTPAGTILCFYGAGKTLSFSGSALRLARFNLEWLEAP